MNEAPGLTGAVEKFTERSNTQIGIIVIGATLIAVSGALQLDKPYNTSILVDNTTNLANIEDNKLGAVIVQNGGIPQFYRQEGYQVCLYTSANKPPLLLRTEGSDRTFLSSNEVFTFDIMLDIPKEKLDRDGLDQQFEIQKSDSCPIRSEPKLVLKTD